ncbi:MAG: hypothetical protein E7365_01775 [Clostridiales bacterium]|nr:hypothetical protein [Clostridiales bacterium]
MKRVLCFLLFIIMLFTGCSESVEPIDVSHSIMDDKQITVPDNISNLAKAIFVATDYVMNTVINKNIKKQPEFISFEFSTDVLLSQSEKDALKEAFECYGIEITDGLRKDLDEIERGITIGYDSIKNTTLEDCDLTIPVKIYYGNDYYTYCCDFKMVKNEYILFRSEFLYRTRYIY